MQTTDFERGAVPQQERRSWISIAAVWIAIGIDLSGAFLGIELAAGMDFWPAILATLVGSVLLGLLAMGCTYVGASTGLTSAAPVPIILVGGGSIIVDSPLTGVSEVVRPPHHGAANAVGVALGDIAGEAEKLVATGDARKRMRTVAAEEAIERAIQAGADPATVATTSIDELPVSYSAGESVRIRARAVGRLRS